MPPFLLMLRPFLIKAAHPPMSPQLIHGHDIAPSKLVLGMHLFAYANQSTSINYLTFFLCSALFLFDFLTLPGFAAWPCLWEPRVCSSCLQDIAAGSAGAALPCAPRSCCSRPIASAAAALQASRCFWLSPAPRTFRKYVSSAPCMRIVGPSHGLLPSMLCFMARAPQTHSFHT